MLLLSDEVGFSEGLSVSGLVLLNVLDLCLKLSSSGDQQVINNILGSVDVDNSILDILFESYDKGIMFVSADTIVEFKFIEFFVDLLDHLFDSTN